MTDFRLCLTCTSRSQASLCHCTQHLISDQIELTIARLRYTLGGDRPSQTTQHAGSWSVFLRTQLDIKDYKGGISLFSPLGLAPKLQRVPPMLHMLSLIPLQTYSKGS